jgi:AraC family transcriptional regulator, regulatory protein of adaptative response / DNA-3-methyladenine glycosylase II
VLRGPATRIRTILAVTRSLADRELRLLGEPAHEVERRLLAVPGIGPWTAGYLAMRVLGDPDVLLVGDLALRQGAARLGLPGDARELARSGAEWSPWRSYAGMHLWRAV